MCYNQKEWSINKNVAKMGGQMPSFLEFSLRALPKRLGKVSQKTMLKGLLSFNSSEKSLGRHMSIF